MPLFKFYTITIGGSDYAALSAKVYDLNCVIRQYMDARKTDLQAGTTNTVERLQSEWEDDPGFQVLQFEKYRFTTEEDRNTALQAVNVVLQRRRDDDDEACRHTDTYTFLIDETEQPQVSQSGGQVD